MSKFIKLNKSIINKDYIECVSFLEHGGQNDTIQIRTSTGQMFYIVRYEMDSITDKSLEELFDWLLEQLPSDKL